MFLRQQLLTSIVEYLNETDTNGTILEAAAAVPVGDIPSSEDSLSSWVLVLAVMGSVGAVALAAVGGVVVNKRKGSQQSWLEVTK